MMIQDPITFEVIKNTLISCAREMSQALRSTAFSPNIKERRDCSCAVFDSSGRLIAQSKDIPVHLGAMPMSVKACIETIGDDMTSGTMALLNDPYSGGSHLPDLTLVAPVHHNEELVAFVANRAHHADVGGVSPGSMPGMSLSIHEEGVVIKPRIVVRESFLIRSEISDLLSSTLTPTERIGDLSAQMAANNVGVNRLFEAASVHSWSVLQRTFDELRQYSATRMKKALSTFGRKTAEFTDFMDSDGAGNWKIPIHVALRFESGTASINFEGTAKQVEGNINCPLASTLSSVYYVFMALFAKDIPANEGCWSVLDVSVPEGSLLHPRYPSAVSAGNVETTQRIVDTTLGAFAQINPDSIPAASQGTMNNLAIGGIDPRSGKSFSFYETIGGGVGASKELDGVSAIHTHMTNTLNTPIESLESEYPLRVLKYAIRRNSGGDGRWKGGDGIVREIEILADVCSVSIQSERRRSEPWGLMGGKPGKLGVNTLAMDDRRISFEAKSTVDTIYGSIVRIDTPGGGGWGSPTSD
ncbi:MAG: hydantoinase B/oxoprolinase family protein [Candidatus Thorarchaeota archaeon]|jgi:N-methylhydantoinase B